MKKKAGLSYFDDGGSSGYDYSGYDYSDPFYTSGYNDIQTNTPYYGNNYGYDTGTGYDYSTGDTYSYDPTTMNGTLSDYYQPDTSDVPPIPTYDPSTFYSGDPSYATAPASSSVTSPGGVNSTTPQPSAPKTATTPNAGTTNTAAKSANTSGTNPNLTYPSMNPSDSGVTHGGMISPLQFIVAHAAEGGIMEPIGGIGYDLPSQQPKFMSEGGLQHLYVGGQGDGTSDEVPAMLSNGEFVIPADVVAGLGNGSNEAGAKRLDEFLKMVRADRQSPDGKLPKDAKSPLEYIHQIKEEKE